MANKSMWNWMDKAEGKEEGSSYKNLQKERVRQGYKPLKEKKEKIAKKMVLPGYKRKKHDVIHEKDDRGVVVSYKPTNYIRKKNI